MTITRNNYEEFFMLYADNELTAAQRSEVEAFVAVNTDLRQELDFFGQFKLQPDDAVVFNYKSSLLKQEADQSMVTMDNYESFFVLYADNELSNPEKTAVEHFVRSHPPLQQAFILLQQAKLEADTNIVFDDKAVLYRTEEDDKVVPFYWWRMAAAAAVILFASGLFLLTRQKKDDAHGLAITTNANPQPAKQPSLQIKNDTAMQAAQQEQVNREVLATADAVKQKQQQKNNRSLAAAEKKIKQDTRNIQIARNVTPKEDIIKEEVAQKEIASKHASIASVNTKPASVEINRNIIAAAKIPITDQPVVMLTPDEDNKSNAQFASVNNDNVEVLNTSVNTKNSLRGFLRKASRIIAKKTNGNEDGNRKGILIGGFEIAVR